MKKSQELHELLEDDLLPQCSRYAFHYCTRSTQERDVIEHSSTPALRPRPHQRLHCDSATPSMPSLRSRAPLEVQHLDERLRRGVDELHGPNPPTRRIRRCSQRRLFISLFFYLDPSERRGESQKLIANAFITERAARRNSEERRPPFPTTFIRAIQIRFSELTNYLKTSRKRA